MISRSKEIHQLREWLLFAPGAVQARLKGLLDDPRLPPGFRSDIHAQLEAARRGLPELRRGCAFPVVPTGGAPSWFRGAVLHAVATWERSIANTRLREAFPEEGRMVEMLEQLVGGRGLGLYVTPNLEQAPGGWLRLQGGSAGGACLLASEAARRGMEVPVDIVVSAAVELSPDGEPMLRPVTNCEQKRRLLELERPGCRFFFIPHPTEKVKDSSVIQLIRLEEGPAQAFIQRILGRPRQSTLEELGRQMSEADHHFWNQRYTESSRIYQKVLDELPSLDSGAASTLVSWCITVRLRLGAVVLHDGKTEEAESHFRQAERLCRENPECNPYSVVELKVGLATACIDRFDPDGARRLLVPLAREWEKRLTREPDGVERRMLLVSILGGMRRLHLLCGQPARAIHVQRKLLTWGGSGQRARSLADLANCLSRAGRFDEADSVLNEARSALEAMPETYRLQTCGFIAYYAGRLSLERGRPLALESELSRLDQELPEHSAARWRLRQLSGLSRLRAGELAALDELVEQMRTEPSALRRWHQCLGLLLGAELAPRHVNRMYAAVAEGMRGIRWSHYPWLEQMRLRFVESVEAGKRNRRAEAMLRSHTPY